MSYSRKNTKQATSPIFRFGPGGEFVEDLNENDLKQEVSNPISELLNAISQLMNSNLPGSTDIRRKTLTEKNIREMANGYEEEKSISKENRDIEFNKSLHQQLTLFPNDKGNSRTSKPQQNNGVRTYCGSSRKRVSLNFTGQGSLFEAHYTI